MKTPTKASIILFVFLKYILFFIFLMIFRNDYQLFECGMIDGIVYFLFFMLPLPALVALLFTYPLFFMFQVKNRVLKLLLIIVILCAEYCVYTYAASPSDLMNGVYNGTISCVFGLIFFAAPRAVRHFQNGTITEDK